MELSMYNANTVALALMDVFSWNHLIKKSKPSPTNWLEKILKILFFIIRKRSKYFREIDGS
jgi:hypothetical protein